jgi:hypothetical protein
MLLEAYPFAGRAGRGHAPCVELCLDEIRLLQGEVDSPAMRRQRRYRLRPVVKLSSKHDTRFRR